MIKNRRYNDVMIIMLIILIIGNILACIPAYCNVYRRFIYPRLADLFGYITSFLPFALGEILMYVGIVSLVVTIILIVLYFVLRKKIEFRKKAVVYFKAISIIIMGVFIIYTFQWITPFRASRLHISEKKEYTVEEVECLRNHIVEQLNMAAWDVLRDEAGHVVYADDYGEELAEALHSISGEFPLLSGYYPPIKEALCHDFLDWMGIGGYTYPYTMEVTCGRYITKIYYPVLAAHELSHHKGYYQEDEASLLSVLACANSEDSVLRYAAYLNMYYKMDNAYWESVQELLGVEDGKVRYLAQPKVSNVVWKDVKEADRELTQMYEEEEHAPQEFAAVAEEVANVGWDTQDKLLGEYSYDGVVLLLLQYYDGKL